MAAKKAWKPVVIVRHIPLRGGYTTGKYPKYYGVGNPLFRVEVDWFDLDQKLIANGLDDSAVKGCKYPADLQRLLRGVGATERASEVEKLASIDEDEFRASDRGAAKDRVRKLAPFATVR
jgi:hypothetical protein